MIDTEPRSDSRGYFARAWCRDEFKQNGLLSEYVQANLSHNTGKGILRGMHYQRAPHAEVKLVRCVRGAIYDVIIDLRVGSPTYMGWEGFELSAENARSLYVPAGYAHGYLTLEDDSDVLYQVSYPFTPQAEGGIRYNDPKIGIKWPAEVQKISEKDLAWPLLQ